MSKIFPLLVCVLLSQVRPAFCAGDGDPLYAGARQAIEEGIPEVGIQKLRLYLAGNLQPAQRAEATLKLAEALLDAGHSDEALVTLGKSRTGAESDFLKARILSAQGRWNEALPLFHSLGAAVDPAMAGLAKQGEAEALYALGRLPEAIAVLESVPDDDSKLRLADFYFEAQNLKKCEALLAASSPKSPGGVQWKKEIEGRLLLAADKPQAALAQFNEILKDTQGAGENLMVSALMGVTGAHLAMGEAEQAGKGVEDFIRAHPDSRYLELLFKRLDQVYSNQENASEVELLKWAENPPIHRQALARFYLGKNKARAKKTDKALADWAVFARDFPDHPLLTQAFLQQGAILLELGKKAEALSAFESAMRKAPDAEALAEAEIAAGRVHFKQGEFLLAANLFRSASDHSERLWETSIYNSALSWLNQGNYEKFMEDYKRLSLKYPEGKLRSELLLEEGLIQARARDPRARESLRLFIRDFPEHPRVAEARVALAERCFLASDFAGAGQYLKVVNTTPQSLETSERAEYLALFLADAAEPRNERKVINACQTFIDSHRKSQLLPEVRMKLGQVYFRREDFANAQTQFELLAAENPGTPYAEMALYLAGKSAAQSMNADATGRALELFEQVKKLSGPLKLYALQQEALIKSRPGTESEAVILFDNILGADPEADLKLAALCGKGNSCMAVANSDPKGLDQAIVVFDLLANDPDSTAFWRNQALYKKGKCLEKQGETSEALVVFYDVLASRLGADAEPDYFWYYKAGFDAAQLLEAGQEWKSAIGIYKKMAAVNGPRSKEAGDRARQLRMEHFIWE